MPFSLRIMNMTNNGEIVLSGRLNGIQRNRLKRLLDMMYKPSELAKEIGFSKRQVYRVYIPLGAPHTKDSQRHIWINGQEFREWFISTYRKVRLDKNQAFCLTCKKAVPILSPIEQQSGEITFLISECPICGRKLARITSNSRRKQ